MPWHRSASAGTFRKQGKTGTTRVQRPPPSGILRGADLVWRAADMGDLAEFKNHFEVQEYAERSGLDYTWMGTKLFAKRARTLPADQFEIRPVRTKRGITMVGLFSAAITQAEREADAPYREAMAAKRLARLSRAERRLARSMARRKAG